MEFDVEAEKEKLHKELTERKDSKYCYEETQQ